ncbi:LPP20 family lipoprotein [Dasania marina]|uniref:LPP20 family lipoprotein n=1 Tax=Dasania marina TaxID=471499 RepID=UPI00037A7DC2|nr:LPP20 family lipoprotein [Dasania marina]
MKTLNLATLGLAASVLLTACGGSPTKEELAKADPYPAWFYNPTVENGIAAASCVPIPGSNVSVAQKQATANGRANLAFQIETKVKAMDKTYDRVTTTNAGSSTGGTFESVSKQVTQQSLSGSRAIKFERVLDDDKKMMCALVALTPEATNQLFKSLVKSAEVNLSPDHESVLKEQFMAYKAQQELDQELMK